MNVPLRPRHRHQNWDAQDFADAVHRALDGAVHHIVLAGHMLIDAKERLDHGEWLRMFRGHATPVERPLPFGARTAQMLMKVAAHPVLSNANHGSHLPTSWRTLYELTKVPEPLLLKALAEGGIHPALERNRVAHLMVATRGLTPAVLVHCGPAPDEDYEAEPDPDPQPPVFSQLTDLHRDLCEAFRDLDAHERLVVIEHLRLVAKMLEQEFIHGVERVVPETDAAHDFAVEPAWA